MAETGREARRSADAPGGRDRRAGGGRRRGGGRIVRSVAGLAGACLAALPGPARGQQPASDDAPAWFPDQFVIAPLLAAPREVGLQGGFYLADRDTEPGFEGRNIEAEVAVGYRIPVVRLADAGPEGLALDLGFEFGIWTRFFMEASSRDLVGNDFRVGAPLSLRYRRFEGRLTLHHTSAHLGDDYVDRFDVPAFQVSREALELVLGVRPIPALRLYGGGDWNVGRGSDFVIEAGGPRVFRTVEEWVGRVGVEYDRGAATGGSAQPFAAVNLEITDRTERVAMHARAGVAFRVRGFRFLFDAAWREGPSTLGAFRFDDESLFGIGLTVQTGGLAPPRPAGSGGR
ncbi:MAG: DUF1207 domain-containing protein [Gemmatimonadota bacterium]|nr:DUF1207 domain-containing protein [Gemmatimonadota bacterium]